MAWVVLGFLGGVVASNRKIITLKPDFSMDGISTIAAGLILVIVLNIASTSHLERRHALITLLLEDAKDVAAAAKLIHDCVSDLVPGGTRTTLSAEIQQKVIRLLQDYSNSLLILENTFALCRLNAEEELKICKEDRQDYRDLVTGGSFPAVDGTMVRAESGHHTKVQSNLRALLIKIGEW